MATAVTEETVTIDGCRIKIRRAGSGEPLLFLHGGDGSGWHPFLDDLAKRFDVIAPEHPGYGTSDTPEWLDGIHDLAFFYLDLMKAQGLRGVHLVGHAIGGWLAAEIAMFDSSRLATLAMIAPPGLQMKGMAKTDIFLMTAEEIARHSYEDEETLAAAVARAVDPAAEEARLKDRYMTARLAWQPRFYDRLLMKWLRRVDLPVHIAWGEADRILPVSYLAGFTERLPQVDVNVIPKAGHMPHLEQKEAFLAGLGRFMDGARRRG